MLVAPQQIGPVAYSGYWGRETALRGDVLVSGAPGDDLGGTNRGSISIYRRTTPVTGQFLIEAERLGPDTPENGAQFGFAVAFIDEGTIVVGAPYKNNGGTNRGSVFVFSWTGSIWDQVQEIQATTDHRWFGYSLASDGVRVVVGAPEPNPYPTGASGDGWVYVYTWNGSQLVYEDSFQDSSAVNSYMHGFGHDVDIDGDTILAGAKSVGGTAGRAFAFVRSGSSWSQQKEFVGASSNFYGTSVGVRGDICAIHDDEGLGWGSVDIWTRSGTIWSLVQTIWEPDGDRDHHFGHSLAFNADGTKLIIGAPSINDDPAPGGAAYVYHLTNGTYAWDGIRFKWDPPLLGDEFGHSVSYDGDAYPYSLAIGGPNVGGGTKGGVKTYSDASLPPYFANQSPAPDETGVDPNSPIYAEILDGDSPFNLETVELYLNGTFVWTRGRAMPGFDVQGPTVVTDGYSYLITPAAPFEAGEQTVRGVAADVFDEWMDESYSFTTHRAIVTDEDVSVAAAELNNIGIDLKLNSHDIKVENYDLVLVAGVEEVAQHVLVGLKLFFGEWFLDEFAGVPYWRDVFTDAPNTRVIETVFRQEILSDADIEHLKAFALELDKVTRKLDVSFTAVSRIGFVEVAAVLP